MLQKNRLNIPRCSTRNTNSSSCQAQIEQAPNAAPTLRHSARIRNQVVSGTKGATSKGVHVTKPKKDHQRAKHYQRVQGDSGGMNRYWSRPPRVAQAPPALQMWFKLECHYVLPTVITIDTISTVNSQSNVLNHRILLTERRFIVNDLCKGKHRWSSDDDPLQNGFSY